MRNVISYYEDRVEILAQAISNLSQSDVHYKRGGCALLAHLHKVNTYSRAGTFCHNMQLSVILMHFILVIFMQKIMIVTHHLAWTVLAGP